MTTDDDASLINTQRSLFNRTGIGDKHKGSNNDSSVGTQEFEEIMTGANSRMINKLMTSFRPLKVGYKSSLYANATRIQSSCNQEQLIFNLNRWFADCGTARRRIITSILPIILFKKIVMHQNLIILTKIVDQNLININLLWTPSCSHIST